MILLVEDDAISRMSFAKTLRGYDYDVLEAADGAEAIHLLEQNHSTIEVVITDMALPRVNGFRVVTNVKTRWPKIPAIVISGYLSEERGHTILGPHVDVLQKPLRPSALVATVQRLAPHARGSAVTNATSTATSDLPQSKAELEAKINRSRELIEQTQKLLQKYETLLAAYTTNKDKLEK